MQTASQRLGQITRQQARNLTSPARNMSSSTTVPAAPWRSTFESHLSKMSSPEFVLATLTATTSSSLPRARYCIHRGFFAELPENKHNDAPRNPQVYESDLPTFTTDVRMEKVKDVHGGAGGDVEAVYWIKDVMCQWRIKGKAYILGGDGVQEEKGRAEVERKLRKGNEAGKDFSWEKEITAHFGNLSPGMRGSFKNPPPGTPVSKTGNDPELKLGQKVEDLNDPVARHNFRLAVIDPIEVEQVDLSDPAEARRWRWTLVDSARWEKVELWP